MQIIRSVLTRKNQFFNSIFYGLIAALFSMCNAGELDFNDIELPPYTPKGVAPIGTTTYTIQELLEKLDDPSIEITEDNTKLISIAYRDTTVFDDYLSVIDLDDVTNPGFVTPGTPSYFDPADTTIPIDSIDLSFTYSSPNNEELDSVLYTAGTITLDIQNGFQSTVDYSFVLSDILNIDTGDTLVLSGTLPSFGTDQVSAPLSNYKTIIERIGNENFFHGFFTGTINYEGGTLITGSEQITYTLTITDAEFSKIFGWFGDKTISIENKSIEIDFFEGISEDGFVFNNPQLNFYIDNGFGVPMGINFDDISATNASGNTVNMSGTITDTPQFVRAPSIENIGETEKSIIKINQTNSNLRDIFAIAPNQFNINLTADANYQNSNDLGDADRNFVIDTSAVEVITEINLPLNLKLTNVSRDFPTGIEGFDFEEADTIVLVLNTINQLPLDGAIDMQFLAADSSVLYQFTDVQFFESPEVPVSGRIETPTEHTSRIEIYRGQGYQELLDASILNLVVRVTSYNADEDNFVKIFSDYELEINVGAEASIYYEF